MHANVIPVSLRLLMTGNDVAKLDKLKWKCKLIIVGIDRK